MSETHFNGEDMARIITNFRPELHDRFDELYPSVMRRMTDICAHPQNAVNLRTADAVVVAMGCPHVLANGAVRVVEGHNRKANGAAPSLAVEPGLIPDVMLPSAPFRKWLERQSRHYRTLTSMYHDMDIPPKQGTYIWRGQLKHVRSLVVEVAASRRGSHIELIYPKFDKGENHVNGA